MFKNIISNKLKSWIIIFGFLTLISLILYYVCMSLNLGPISIVISLIFSVVSTWGSYYYSDKIILGINKARPATKAENLQLVNILDSLVTSSGLSCTPRLYIIEDEQPNAFATGRNPENSIICVTTGLLEKLEYHEIEGVLAHEMAHIANYDIRLSAIVSVMVGFIVMLSDMFTRIAFFGGLNNNDDDNKGNALLMLIGFICLLISPIFSTLMQLAVSRKREFLADATAIKFTQNPDGLISALIKISNDPNQLKVSNNATENMYIVNPFRSSKKKKSSSIWSTHPSTKDRIEALKKLKNN